MNGLVIRPFEERDVGWAENLIGADFGGRLQARLGLVVDALTCRGLVGEVDGDRVGLITFQQDGADVEIVYVEVTTKRRGVGTRLVDAVAEVTGAERLWLVTDQRQCRRLALLPTPRLSNCRNSDGCRR